MPIVAIIMPQSSLVSRDLALHISVPIGQINGHCIASICFACGIFMFTNAAQFTLHLISPLRQLASSEPIHQASEVEQVHYAE